MSIFSKIFNRGGWEDLSDGMDMDPYEDAVWAAPRQPDVVHLDTISVDDLSVPEELRGCEVIERRFPDGTTKVIYQATDGFCVDEQGADVLIEAYRHERKELSLVSPVESPVVSEAPSVYVPAARPVTPPSRPRARLVSHPPPPVPPALSPSASRPMSSPPPPPVPPALSRSASRPMSSPPPQHVSPPSVRVRQPSEPDSDLEVLDRLPMDDSVPAKLRGASLVLDGGKVFYLTAAGVRVEKEQAEDWLEVWEKSMSGVKETGSGEETEAGKEHEDTVAPGRGTDLTGEAMRKDSLIAAQEEDPWRLAMQRAEAHLFSDVSPAGISETDFERRRQEPVKTVEHDREAERRGEAVSVPGWRAEPVKTVEDDREEEGRLTFRGLVNKAVSFRDKIIKGEVRTLDEAFSSGDFMECVKVAVFERLPDERVERMLKHSLAAGEELSEAWKDYKKEIDRTMSGDLKTGRQVALVLDSFRINDLDIRKIATLSVLRSVDAKRDAVLRDLARGFRSSCRTDLTNYLMARSFLDEWKWKTGNEEAMVARGSLEEKDVRRVFESLVFVRLEESLDALLQAVAKRHGLSLEFLKPFITERLVQIIESVASELLSIDE